MTIQFFAPRFWDGSIMKLPNTYRRKVRWLPEIGDIFPNFHLVSTHGPIEFWDWAEGNWTYLFSHPAARTPVCTTELGSIAANGKDFANLGVKALGLSGSSIEDQQLWHREVEELYGHDVWFPTGQDESGDLLDLFGACHAREAEGFPIRKSFILDPQMRIRMIFEYPIHIGRSADLARLPVRRGGDARVRNDFQTPVVLPARRGRLPALAPRAAPARRGAKHHGVRSRMQYWQMEVAAASTFPGRAEMSRSRNM